MLYGIESTVHTIYDILPYHILGKTAVKYLAKVSFFSITVKSAKTKPHSTKEFFMHISVLTGI